MSHPIDRSDPIVAAKVYQIVNGFRHNVIRVAPIESWFPIPPYHGRFRLYRGLLVGATAPAAGSPTWAYYCCRDDDEPFAEHLRDCTMAVIAAPHGALRDFLNGRDLPIRVRDMVQSTVTRCAIAGRKSFDGIPFAIHAIEDPTARRQAVRAFLNDLSG